MFGTNFASEALGGTGTLEVRSSTILPLGKEIPMGYCVPAPVRAHNLSGLQYFRLLGPLFDHLHAVGTARDRAGNRQLFYDQYATLLLLYFFNPTVTSLRGLQPLYARCWRQRATGASCFSAPANQRKPGHNPA